MAQFSLPTESSKGLGNSRRAEFLNESNATAFSLEKPPLHAGGRQAGFSDGLWALSFLPSIFR
jgi:hypothetical protein